MIYNLSTGLKNLDGSDAVEDGAPATVLKGLRTALVSDPQGLTATDKASRYRLLIKLKEGENELTVDEAAILKKAAEVYPTLIYGQLCAFLDQA